MSKKTIKIEKPTTTIPLIDPMLKGLTQSEAVCAFLRALNLPAMLLSSRGDCDQLRFLFVNTALEELSGFSGADLVGESPSLLLGEDTDYEAADAFRKEVEQNGQGFTTMTHYRKNGMPYEVVLLGTRLSDLNNDADRGSVFASFVFHLADNDIALPRPPFESPRSPLN